MSITEETKYFLRENVNFYYDKEKEKLHIINAKKVVTVNADMEFYNKFKEKITIIYHNKYLQLTQEYISSLDDQKIIALLNKSGAFYEDHTGMSEEIIESSLFTVLKKFDTDPIHTLQTMKKICFVTGEIKENNTFVNEIHKNMQEFGYESICAKSPNENCFNVIVDLYDNLDEYIKKEQINGFINTNVQIPFSCFFVNDISIEKIDILYQSFALRLQRSAPQNFIQGIYRKVIPYFVTQCICNQLSINTLFFDENYFPQYINGEFQLIKEDTYVAEKEKLIIEKFPQIDVLIKSKRSFIKFLELSNGSTDMPFCFVLEGTENKLNLYKRKIVGRTYKETYETAILIAVEISTGMYCLSSISHAYNTNDYKDKLITYTPPVADLEFLINLKKFYHMPSNWKMMWIKNKDLLIVKIEDDKKRLLAVDMDYLQLNQKLMERVLCRALNRTKSYLKELKFNVDSLIYIDQIYYYDCLTLYKLGGI